MAYQLSRRTLVSIIMAALIGTGIAGYFSYQASQKAISAPALINGDIITLKELTMDDAVAYHEVFSDAVRDPLEFPPVITLGYTIYYLKDELRKAHAGKMLMYGIVDNNDNKLVGCIQIREKNDTDPGQLGCWLNENYWGGGRIQEALKLITKAYFKLHPEAKSYLIYVTHTNHRSYGAMMKFGCKDTGTTDRHYRVLVKTR